MQRPKVQPSAASEKLFVLQVEIRSGLSTGAEAPAEAVEWNGYFLLACAVHSRVQAFRNSTHGLS